MLLLAASADAGGVDDANAAAGTGRVAAVRAFPAGERLLMRGKADSVSAPLASRVSTFCVSVG